MTLEEINELIKHLNELTEDQKKELANSIIANPEARDIAARGALLQGNFPLFIDISFRDQTQLI
jgi:hypothetical protein